MHEEYVKDNEKSDNKQCLLDAPLRSQAIIKESYQNAKSQRKNIHNIKAMALLRVTREITIIVLAPSS